MAVRAWSRAALGVVLLLAGSTARAADPPETWRTIHTEHFRIHFDERNIVLARRLAALAEESHEQLVPVFGLTYDPPMDIVINDNVDTANGSARSIDYNLIRIFAYPPEADSTLGDADDWVRGLFVHEYIHILHINEISGVWSVINSVLGKTYAPNQVLPRWYIEGLATYGESTFLEGGRLRNNAYRMYLRMDALNGGLRDVGFLSGVPHAWPGATAWYLYGSDFVDYVARTYGQERWLEFNEHIGGALSPIAINAYAREVFGQSMLELWAEYQLVATAEFEDEAAEVEARGFTPVELITEGGHMSGYPRCRTPFDIGFVSNDGDTQRTISTANLMTGERETWTDVYGNGTFDWHPNGRTLIYSQSTRSHTFYAWNDLYAYDSITDTHTRLTHGERAREPGVSPDGRHVAYMAVNDWGGADLRELEMATGEVRSLYESADFELVSMPSYSPDGRTIAFSLWRIGAFRDIFLMDRETGELTQITDDRAQDLEPSFSPDGRELYFSSDRTGIYNAYAYELETGRLRQITNVLGGVFSPRRCSPDGPLFVRTYGHDGFDVGYVADTVTLEALEPYERPEIEYPDIPEDVAIVEETSYNPWTGLVPRSWSPVVSEDSDGVILGAELAAFDPAGFHAWAASATWGIASESWAAALRYTYFKLPVDISLFFSRSESQIRRRYRRRSQFVPFEQETLSGGASLVLPLGDDRSGHALGLSYSVRGVRVGDLADVGQDPSDIEPLTPEDGRFDSVSLSWSWSDRRGFRYTVTNASGTRLNAGLTVRAPFTGADFESLTFGWGLRHYIQNPFWPDQILALLVTGGVGRSSFDNRPLFAVGGFPDQDVLQALVDQTPIGAGFLRGYEPLAQVGEQFHLLNAEYRIPFWEPDAGAWTLPFFVERFYVAGFVDYGTAVNEWEGFSSFLVGVGVEVRMQAWVGYSLPADFRLGYARGLSDGGLHDVYLLFGGTF